jgi:uncharacterized protein
MNVLIDIGHPGHVHLFHPLALKMMNNGDKILFTCRQKEAEISLLEAFGFDFVSFGKHYNSLLGKITGLIRFDFKMLKVALKFKPDLYLSHGSVYASHIAFLTGKKNICLEDTGNKEQVFLYKPFTKFILTPSVFPDLYGRKQIKYNGYHELAYLSPEFFQPDDDIYNYLSNPSKQKYAIIRFVSWKATHDFGKGGLNNTTSERLVNFFIENGYLVYISSEKAIPDFLEKYRINIPSHLFHHALYFADMVVGDSQTIVAEAGILGTPAIRFNDLVGTSHGYHHKELEEVYGLIFNIHTKNENELFRRISELINTENIKQEWKRRRDLLLKNKINVTEFLYQFILKLVGK